VISKRRIEMAAPEEMWQCQTTSCGYIYNPDRGDRKGKIPKGTLFEELPDDAKCPVCGATKKSFRPLVGTGADAARGSS
jgi:rubredoxin